MRMANMENGNTVIGEGNMRKGVRVMRKGNVVMWAGCQGTWGRGGGGEHWDEEHEDGKQTGMRNIGKENIRNQG
jgi:hypothetical protein